MFKWFLLFAIYFFLLLDYLLNIFLNIFKLENCVCWNRTITYLCLNFNKFMYNFCFFVSPNTVINSYIWKTAVAVVGWLIELEPDAFDKDRANCLNLQWIGDSTIQTHSSIAQPSIAHHLTRFHVSVIHINVPTEQESINFLLFFFKYWFFL